MDNNNVNNNNKEYEHKTPSELARDFIVEAPSESGDEFMPTPEEYIPAEYFETSEEFEEERTIEASDNARRYGSSDMHDNSAETAYEYGVNPEDEQAATCDENYRATESARARCALDDYEIISDVLGSEKQIVKLYSAALCEAAEEPLRNVIRDNLDEAAADQYKAFEYMSARGMYKTEQASEQDIINAKQQFKPLCADNNCGCDYDCDCGDYGCDCD